MKIGRMMNAPSCIEQTRTRQLGLARFGSRNLISEYCRLQIWLPDGHDIHPKLKAKTAAADVMNSPKDIFGVFKSFAKLIETKKRNDGEGGIRTHGGVTPTPVFETGLFNRSSTSPEERPPILAANGQKMFCYSVPDRPSR